MKVYSADQIAEFMLAKSDPDVGDVISNLKLQKLVYYAAGVMAAVRADNRFPLFADKIKAWQHGPVIPSQYHRYSSYGSSAIPSPENFDFSVFDRHDLEILDDVYEFYGQYSAWKLRNMTHEEDPWLSSVESDDNTISNKQLAAYFTDEIDESYIADYQKKARQH